MRSQSWLWRIDCHCHDDPLNCLLKYALPFLHFIHWPQLESVPQELPGKPVSIAYIRIAIVCMSGMQFNYNYYTKPPLDFTEYNIMHVNIMAIEARIYSRTNIFSDCRLQKSKHGSNCARSSEQQDMLALGQFSIPKNIVVHRDRKSCLKIRCKTTRNFFSASFKRKDHKGTGITAKQLPACKQLAEYVKWLTLSRSSLL